MNTLSTGRLEVRDATGAVVGYLVPADELARLDAHSAALRQVPPPPPPPRTGSYADLTEEQLMVRWAHPDVSADEKARLLAELEAIWTVKYAEGRRLTQEAIAHHPASKLSTEEWIAGLYEMAARGKPSPPGHRVDCRRETIYGDDEP